MRLWCQGLFFRRKDELKVDLGDLQDEAENLSNFLFSQLKVSSSVSRKGLELKAQGVSAQELERVVNKFVHHRNLNSTHWVALEKNAVKIYKFNQTKKAKENKNPVQPSVITHGW
jgi:hypothetical protein